MTAEELVNVALSHGMVPKVVPAFRHVSVGGAVSVANQPDVELGRPEAVHSKLRRD